MMRAPAYLSGSGSSLLSVFPLVNLFLHFVNHVLHSGGLQLLLELGKVFLRIHASCIQGFSKFIQDIPKARHLGTDRIQVEVKSEGRRFLGSIIKLLEGCPFVQRFIL